MTRSPRILWADDQPGVANTISSLLEPISPVIDHVADGEAVLSAITDSWYDLIVLDLQMPPGEWGGLWVMKELQDKPSAAPVLVLSGEGGQRETIQSMRLGASDYVKKDDVEAELLHRVQHCLSNRSGTVQELIDGGETDEVEFKATLRFNLESRSKDRRLERSVLKTIAGFLNSRGGGHLLIGVRDDGIPVGLAGDYELLRKPNRDPQDSFANHLTQVAAARLGSTAASYWQMSFPEIDGTEVCHVRCGPSSLPVWYSDGDERVFYLRTNNSTSALAGEDLEGYLSVRYA